MANGLAGFSNGYIGGMYNNDISKYNIDWLGEQAASSNWINPQDPQELLKIHSGVTNQDLLNAGYTPVNTKLGNNGGGLFGLSAGTLGALGGVAQGLAGLASAYTGFKAYQSAQDQFNFQKKLANRNLANQAKIINNSYDNAGQVAAGLIGGQDAQGNFGMTDQAVVDRYARKAKEKHVDGSAIG